MDSFSLIANSGIQLLTFRLKLNTQDKFKMWFREWYDTSNGQWRLDLAHEVTTDDNVLFYDKHELFDGGYLNDPTIEYDPIELRNDGINPLKIDDEMCNGVRGELYKLTFSDKHNALKNFENKWIPIPYFFKRTEKRFKFSPMNWSRVKFVPRSEGKTELEYDVILAFDTRAGYSAMEDYRIDIMIDKGPSARSIQIDLNPFTLVGATTRSGLLTAPLRARFGINLHLEYYDDDILSNIIRRSASILDVPCSVRAASEIASRSRGTPRIANALLRRVRDFAQVKGSGSIDTEIAQFALEALNIDKYGLDEIDNKILCTIIDKFKGGPVGITTIATALGEDAGTIEEVYEPFLIKEGFMKRTPRGREVTELAYKHLGRSLYNSQKTLFND